jgi:hypothetical protein
MADISTELQAIQEAVYGEEVRSAIVDALEAMNEIDEDAEAYAVGTRGGTAVPSTDPAYQNNAKYWAEQAADSAATLVTDTTLSHSGEAADSATVGGRFALITEETSNLWRDGDVDITSSGGFKQFALSNPLPAGTYTFTMSCKTQYTGTPAVVLYSSGTSFSNDNRITTIYMKRNGRASRVVTSSVDIKGIRFYSGNDASSSSGKTATYSFIQVDEGQTATPYVSGFSAVDSTARAGDLYATGDTTNRAEEIKTRLEVYGFCHLTAGDYYVTEIAMPDNTKLYGDGRSTRIILLGDSTTEGHTIRLGDRCTVESLTIAGSVENIELPEPGEEVSRNGILFNGKGRLGSVITGCWIYGFSGGGIRMAATGYGTNGCRITNCQITNCFTGIWIPRFSEYNKISNCIINLCYYGFIDNGGNNVISNCGFDSNNVGIYIFDTGSSTNNTHGSFSNCTINHSYSADARPNGVAIRMAGSSGNELQGGMVFNGCQIWYGGVELTTSFGVAFIGCNFGTTTPITITGGNALLFSSCLFRSASDSPITVTGSSERTIKFIHCYARSSGSQIGGDYAEP